MKKRIMLLLVLLSILPLRGAGAGQSPESYDDWKNQPAEHFTDAEASFKRVKQMLLDRYLDSKLTEDQLYQAATDGMLRSLNGGAKSVYNKLITPTELAEMKIDLQGKFNGVGIEVKFDEGSDVADVIKAIPGSPAEKAGIKDGDEIVSVDGKLVKGLQLRDVVYAIRGTPGEKVKLKILRGDSLVTKEVTRETRSWNSVVRAMLGNVGVIAISNFNETTSASFAKELKELREKGMTSLIVDLRGNSGGLFDSAVQAAGAILPTGSVVARLDKRDGTEEEIRSTAEPVVTGSIPIAVLVNGETASSAELFTQALADDLGAKVIGARTKGKWNVQTIEDLPNGFAVRFTTGNFKSPRGHAFPDVGIEPDVLVASTGAPERFDGQNLEKLNSDSALRAAVSLFIKKPVSND